MPEIILKAKIFAKNKHYKKYRADGFTPYFQHIQEVVNLIKEWKIDNVEIIVTAYLHDVLEKTNTTHQEIEKFFGKQILENIKLLSFDEKRINEQDYYKNNYNNVVKLADHLTNTIYFNKNKLRNPFQYYKKGKVLIDYFRYKDFCKETIKNVENFLFYDLKY